MKLRHTAALALVGWYLLMPLGPINVPINQKSHVRSFDSARKCEAYRDHLLAGRAVPLKDLPDEVNPALRASPAPADIGTLRLLQSECIATDDPRLRK